MKSFRTASLADQVFEKLEDDIVYGVYKRGELLTELKLAETLGVSRTPIREALRRLEQERLIEDSGKGSVVLGITKEDLMDIMDIRQRIEGLASFYRNVIIDTLIPLHRKTRLYRKISMEDNERSPKTMLEHLEIARAIISGDGELAKELTEKHIENAKIHMMGCVKING